MSPKRAWPQHTHRYGHESVHAPSAIPAEHDPSKKARPPMIKYAQPRVFARVMTVLTVSSSHVVVQKFPRMFQMNAKMMTQMYSANPTSSHSAWETRLVKLRSFGLSRSYGLEKRGEHVYAHDEVAQEDDCLHDRPCPLIRGVLPHDAGLLHRGQHRDEDHDGRAEGDEEGKERAR